MDHLTHVGEKEQGMAPTDVLGDLRQGQLDTEVTTSQSRRVLLKIDSIVMPLIVIAMTLAFLDKVSLYHSFPFFLLENQCLFNLRMVLPTQRYMA
jgi:hypothetical protein